jgi:hypothetical protein
MRPESDDVARVQSPFAPSPTDYPVIARSTREWRNGRRAGLQAEQERGRLEQKAVRMGSLVVGNHGAVVQSPSNVLYKSKNSGCVLSTHLD